MKSCGFIVFGLCAGIVGCSNGGSTSDAGTDASPVNDAGGADVVSDAASGNDASDASTCGSCTGYTYCDTFESYPAGPIANAATLGPWTATVTGTGAVMQIDTTNAYCGTKALRITVPTNAGEDAGTAARGSLNQTATAGLIPGNDIFGRTMVYYSNVGGNDLPYNVHSWLFSSAGNSAAADGGVNMNMGSNGAAPMMLLNYHPPAPLTEQSVTGGSITAAAWHCVQWQYDGSGNPPNDTGAVWVDGTQVVTAKSKGWNFATPWSSFDFGFTHYEILANAVDVYLDDFALSNTMVPCP
jgi:hypothetical protein